jgi:hypothetical protein
MSVPNCFPRPKPVAEKVEELVRKVATPVHILAIDDFRLLRMQQQLADRKAVGKRAP